MLSASTAAIAAASGEEFHAAMGEAMARMHRAMAAGGATGDVDREFAEMMIPHHQGAVDMAILEIRHGTDERLRRLAHGIIVEQQQEIRLMRQVLAGMEGRGTRSDHGSGRRRERHQ